MSAASENVLVRVLGEAELVIGGKLTPVPGNFLKVLLAELVIAGEQGATVESLLHHVWAGGTDPGPAGLHQLVRRLRNAGLKDHLPRQTRGRYRLAMRTDQVDAWKLLDAARRLDKGPPVDDTTLDAAAGLWRGPVAGVHSSRGERFTTAFARLDAERRRRNKPRVLILDDKVGHSIEAVLGDFRCTVLTDIEEFWPIADRCEELFDAALVDLHLDVNDSAAAGLAVLGVLQRTRLPAVLMTFKPTEGDFAELASRYGLYGTFIKSSNDASGNFTGLRAKVEEMVEDGAEEVLIRRADADLGICERKARKRIAYLRQGDVARRAMEADVDAIRARIRSGADVSAVRSALAQFRAKWVKDR